MRILSIGILSFAVCVMTTSSSAGGLQPPPPGEGTELNQLLAPQVPQSLDLDKETVGLSKESRPEILTWERIYALALVRARAVRGAFAPSLDPTALNQEAARYGVADFARFRNDFVSVRVAAGGVFRDPGPHVLGLLRRLNTIDNARHVIAVYGSVHRLLQERSQAESSGANRLDVDLVDVSSLRAEQNLADEIRQFRDGLDELKFMLGLSPHAAVILDRQNLAPFGAVHDSVANWTRMSTRNLQDLHKLVARLPAMGEVVLDGQPLFAQVAMNPNRWEELLRNAAQTANKNRSEREKFTTPGNAGVQLELQVRRRIRNLFDATRAYEREKQLYEHGIRTRDQTFERLVAPAVGVSSSRSASLEQLIDQISRVGQAEDRLISLWTSFRAERLALYRDLGTLPYNNWKSFYDDLAAPRAGAAAVPAVPPGPASGDAH